MPGSEDELEDARADLLTRVQALIDPSIDPRNPDRAAETAEITESAAKRAARLRAQREEAVRDGINDHAVRRRHNPFQPTPDKPYDPAKTAAICTRNAEIAFGKLWPLEYRVILQLTRELWGMEPVGTNRKTRPRIDRLNAARSEPYPARVLNPLSKADRAACPHRDGLTKIFAGTFCVTCGQCITRTGPPE